MVYNVYHRHIINRLVPHLIIIWRSQFIKYTLLYIHNVCQHYEFFCNIKIFLYHFRSIHKKNILKFFINLWSTTSCFY
ncbi:hypothetical protein [African swine fever virus]